MTRDTRLAPAEYFADWCQRLYPPPHTDAKVARDLGISRQQVWRLRTGQRPLTRPLRLAMTAITHGLAPYAEGRMAGD